MVHSYRNQLIHFNFKLIDFYDRSSRPEVFCKKGVLKNFTKFTGKHLCQGLFFDRDSGAGVFLTFCEIFKNNFF